MLKVPITHQQAAPPPLLRRSNGVHFESFHALGVGNFMALFTTDCNTPLMAQVFFTCGHNRAPGPIYTHLGLLYLHLPTNSIQPLWGKCFALVHTEPVPSHQCLRPPSLPFSALWPPFRGHRPPLCALRLAVPTPSHQLRLRYSVSSQLLIPFITMLHNRGQLQ